MEQNNGGNANLKYCIKWFKWHLLGAVDVAVDVSVAGVIFFWLLISLFFEKKRQTKMKLKVIFKKQNKRTAETLIAYTPSEALTNKYPIMLMLLLLLLTFL